LLAGTPRTPLDKRHSASGSIALVLNDIAMEWQKKQKEYEIKKARAKALKLRLTCTICGATPKMLLNCLAAAQGGIEGREDQREGLG